MRKPRVHLQCPANARTVDTERIIEFGWTNSQGELCGGLISLHGYDDRLIVEVYHVDTGVEIRNETVLGNVLKRILERLPTNVCVSCQLASGHKADCEVEAARRLLAEREARKGP